jgi:hypothetical protein
VAHCDEALNNYSFRHTLALVVGTGAWRIRKWLQGKGRSGEGLTRFRCPILVVSGIVVGAGQDALADGV